MLFLEKLRNYEKSKMDILPRLRRKNSYHDTGGYRAKKISSFLPEMQAGNID
jgi:hypothetical protein